MSHYDTLGVDIDATPAAIKAAFRRLASELHPDRGGDAESMAAVNRAYEVLSDPEKRRIYDETGDDGPQRTHEQAVSACLMGAFARFLDARQNIVAAVRGQLTAERDQFRAVLKQNEALAPKLKETRDTVATKDGKPNFVHMLIDQRLRGMEMAAAQINEQIKLLDDALAMLADYTCSTIEFEPKGSYQISMDELYQGGNPFRNRFEGP